MEAWKARAAGAAALCALAAGLSANTAMPDLFGYLAFGVVRETLGHIPASDPFSYLPTLSPWIFHEWLSGVFLFSVYARAGGAGLMAVKILCGAAAAALLFKTARLRGARPAPANAALFLAAPHLVLGFPAVRAQIFTYLLFALTLLALESWRRGRGFRHLAFLPPVFALWANLHGGFPMGFLALAAYLPWAFANGRARALMTVLPLCLGATLANPYGPDLWGAVLIHAAAPDREITEWLPLWSALARGGNVVPNTLFLILLAGFCLLRAGSRGFFSPGVLLALSTAAMGFYHQRHQVLFALVFAVFAPPGADTPRAPVQRLVRSPWPALVLAPAVLYVCLTHADPRPWRLSIPGAPGSGGIFYPKTAVLFMKEHGVEGRVFTDYGWGSYLSFILWPECKVAVDGRAESVFSKETREAYWAALWARPGGDAFLKNRPCDFALLRLSAPAAARLTKNPEWRLVFLGDGAALFARENAGQGGGAP
jgi:hypothetical protein